MGNGIKNVSLEMFSREVGLGMRFFSFLLFSLIFQKDGERNPRRTTPFSQFSLLFVTMAAVTLRAQQGQSNNEADTIVNGLQTANPLRIDGRGLLEPSIDNSSHNLWRKGDSGKARHQLWLD